MGLYKEIDHEFRELARKQKRIYNDACDAGIKVDGAKDTLCLYVKGLLENKELIGGIKKHRKQFNHGASFGVEVKLFLPWEADESDPQTNSVGTEWTITYVHDRTRKIQFISLYPQRASWKNKDIWER